VQFSAPVAIGVVIGAFLFITISEYNSKQLAVKTFVLFSVILVLAFSMACGYTK